MYIVIGIFLIILFFAAIGRLSRNSENGKSNYQGSSSTSRSQSLNSKNSLYNNIDADVNTLCEKLTKVFEEEGIPFAGMEFDMRKIQAIYCQDPQCCENEMVGAAYYFYGEIIDIRRGIEGQRCLIIGSTRKVTWEGSNNNIMDTAEVYIASDIVDQYFSIFKIGLRVGVMGRLVQIDKSGMIMALGIPICINKSIIPMTNMIFKDI